MDDNAQANEVEMADRITKDEPQEGYIIDSVGLQPKALLEVDTRPLPVPRSMNAQPAVSRLSDDLLQNIFELLSTPVPRGPIQLQTYHKGVHHYGLPAPQIALSHVCQRWRRLALSTATLWNQLSLDSPEQIPLIEQLIQERAKDLPLDLTLLDIHPFFEPLPSPRKSCRAPFTKHLSPALPDFLNTHLPQLRTLTVFGCQLTLPHLFHPSYPLSPTLQRLDLVLIPFSMCDGYDLHGPPPGEPVVHPYSPLLAPNLRTLHLDRLRLPYHTFLDSSTLRTLSVQKSATRLGQEGHEALLDLAHLPALEHLQYTLSTRDPSEVFWTPLQFQQFRSNEISENRISLPRLKTLDLWCARTWPRTVLQFFEQLDLPGLEDLRLRRWDDSFFFGAKKGEELVGILRLLKGVRRLGVEMKWKSWGRLVDSLKEGGGEGVLLPELRWLGVADLGGWSKEPTPPSQELLESLEGLVLLRRAAQDVPTLEEISCDVALPEEWVMRVRAMGCEVQVREMNRPYESWWYTPNAGMEDD